MNELLFFLTIILSFLGVLTAFRFWGKAGLFAWIGFSTILVNIEVLKCVDIFGMSVTLGNVLYGSTFLCTDILSENYGGKHSRKAVMVGFFTLLAFLVLSQISLWFVPNESDFISPALKTILGAVPRLVLASVTAFFVSNTLDTYLYEFWGKFTDKIWVKNNLSTLVSQAVDIVIFAFIGWAGLFPWNVFWELVWTSYLMKFIVAICDTPFAYWGKSIYKKYHSQNE